MPIPIPLGFYQKKVEAAGPVAPVLTPGSYRYFDMGDANSFQGLTNNFMDISDNVIPINGVWQLPGGGITYPTTAGGPFVFFYKTGGNSSQGNFTLGGGATGMDPAPWPATFTFEAGFRLTQTSSFNFSLFNVRSGQGIFWSGDRFVFQGIAAYTFSSAVTSQYSLGNSYIMQLRATTATNLEVWLNGSLAQTITISSSRPSVGGTAWQFYGAYANGSNNNGGQEFDFSFSRMYTSNISNLELKNNYNFNATYMGLPIIP